MRAADIVGKKVKAVRQELEEWNSGHHWTMKVIEFTDGTEMWFSVVEGEGEYGVIATTSKDVARKGSEQ